MTYGQGRLVSNIGPGQSSALRPISERSLLDLRREEVKDNPILKGARYVFLWVMLLLLQYCTNAFAQYCTP
jgi:hypothetical protein